MTFSGHGLARWGTGRGVVALLAVAGLLVGLAGPAPGATVTATVGTWSAAGPADTYTVTSTGDQAAASMSYHMDPAGLSTTRSWDFTRAVPAQIPEGAIEVPYTFTGYHGYYDVTVELDMIVDGQYVEGSTLASDHAAACCDPPSGGFTYSGVARFYLPQDAHTFGFRMIGSNFDSDNQLSGTLTLTDKPYVDPTIGQPGDNRQWTGAKVLDTDVDDVILKPGESRWFKIPVTPSQHVSVTLSQLPKDYDVALFGDIQAAFDRLTDPEGNTDLTSLTAGSSAAGAVTADAIPKFPASVTDVPTNSNQVAGSTFAPRVYAPRVYAPRVYAPRVYAPRVYAPRVYAPDSYDPNLGGSQAFRDAFTGAQSQALLAVSAKQGSAAESVSANTGNTKGYFYVRVQGHDENASSASTFHLHGESTGGAACAQVSPSTDSTTEAPTVSDAETVIVTDTSSPSLGTAPGAETDAFADALLRLQRATHAAVVDVAGNQKIQDLLTQAHDHFDCPYAMNLAAQAIKDVVDGYRNPMLKYVVIVGSDDVVPFFRYLDLSGLGAESQFQDSGLVNHDNASAGSLDNDQVLSQDDYGSDTSVTVAAATIPIPDLAVGRLVETPEEIESTIDHFIGQRDAVSDLPTPDSSFVSGYDFLTDAAHAVDGEFAAAVGREHADTLINDTWQADDLQHALLDRHHSLVYLAGHFSANDTLAADFESTLDADVLDPANPVDPQTPRPLEDSLVLSAGCHSGYNTVSALSGYPPDWAERMAQQHAVLVGGTGYQYGDSDFLAYSERLYLQVARELRRGHEGDPVPVGSALVNAKQDYLAGLTSLTGIDQKAMLEATVYGLPMTRIDIAEAGRTGDGGAAAGRTPSSVGTGPGSYFGLSTEDLSVDTPTTEVSKSQDDAAGDPHELSWFNGADGVTVEPGVPALPKQVEDVTAAGLLLRGVGFRSGHYHQAPGRQPLTGAPAIEGTTPHTSFFTPSFYPQRLTSVNYFDMLSRDSGGRTSLILTPAQYRSESNDPDSTPFTNTVRSYSNLGLRLYYSDLAGPDTSNRPEQALPPEITGVTGTAAGRIVTFSAHVTGDPSAGVQEVWVTWSGGPNGSGDGTWASVDLAQDSLDSSLWSGTLTLPDSVQRGSVRFLVQASNGIGAVSLDTAAGDGYPVSAAGVDTGIVKLQVPARPTTDSLGITAQVKDGEAAPLNSRAVRFRLSQGTTTLSDAVGITDSNGNVTMPLAPGVLPPVGSVQVTADLLPVGGGDTPVSTDAASVTVAAPVDMTLAVAGDVTAAAPGITSSVTTSGSPASGRYVRFRISQAGVTAVETTARTNASGVATFPVLSSATLPVGTITVVADLMPVTGSTPELTRSQVANAPADALTVSPSTLSTRAGMAYPSPPTATVKDANGLGVPNAPVTFTVVGSGNAPWFPPAQPGGPRRSTVTTTTGADGRATAPTLTAGTTVGVFKVVVTTPRSTTSPSIAVASQYGFTKFVSPVVANGGTTTAKATSTTPVKVSALEANGAKIADAVGTSLASNQKVRITWTRTAGTAGGPAASASPVFMKYDAGKDFFQADLKASTMGWKKGNTYQVLVTVISTPACVVDLGSTSFSLKIG